jgi:hypothetical protein
MADPAAGADDGDFLIAAVCENRSREVAIATMSTTRTHALQAYLVTDMQSYSETLDLLLALKPREILLPDSTRRRPLSEKIAGLATAEAPNAATPAQCLRPIFVNRNYYDQVQFTPSAFDASWHHRHAWLVCVVRPFASRTGPLTCSDPTPPPSRLFHPQDRGAETLKRLSITPIDSDVLDSVRHDVTTPKAPLSHAPCSFVCVSHLSSTPPFHPSPHAVHLPGVMLRAAQVHGEHRQRAVQQPLPLG